MVSSESALESDALYTQQRLEPLNVIVLLLKCGEQEGAWDSERTKRQSQFDKSKGLQR